MDWYVRRRGADLFLMERTWVSQGVSPDYENLCRLSEREGATLMSSRLIHAWTGTIANGPAKPDVGTVSDFLSLQADDHGVYVLLTLPVSDIRPKPFEREVPGYRDLLTSSRRKDLAALDHFVANTGAKPLAVA